MSVCCVIPKRTGVLVAICPIVDALSIKKIILEITSIVISVRVLYSERSVPFVFPIFSNVFVSIGRGVGALSVF